MAEFIASEEGQSVDDTEDNNKAKEQEVKLVLSIYFKWTLWLKYELKS